MTTLLESQRKLESMVKSMSNFKGDYSKRGKEMYNDYKKKSFNLINELRNKGVNEESYPIFKNSVRTFNYWK